MSSGTRTRSGRKVKAPERWEPKEECVDDFRDDEYDSDDGSDVSSIVSYDSEEEEEEDDDGSDLEDFIVDDDEEEEVEEDDEDDEEDYDPEDDEDE